MGVSGEAEPPVDWAQRPGSSTDFTRLKNRLNEQTWCWLESARRALQHGASLKMTKVRGKRQMPPERERETTKRGSGRWLTTFQHQLTSTSSC